MSKLQCNFRYCMQTQVPIIIQYGLVFQNFFLHKNKCKIKTIKQKNQKTNQSTKKNLTTSLSLNKLSK